MVEIVELAMIGQLVLGQPDTDHVVAFAELLHSGGEIDAIKSNLDRRYAAPDAVEKSPARHLIEHAKRLKFGRMVYLLPLYYPLRLIDEICRRRRPVMRRIKY